MTKPKIIKSNHVKIKLLPALIEKANDNDCIDFTIGNDKSYVVTVKHTLWWKIGIILSYTILIGMALWMLFKE